MTQEKSFKGKVCIYVRKYGTFPLKVEKFDSFYKPWCMPDQIKGGNDYNSNQPTKGLEKVVCQDNLVDKILKLKYISYLINYSPLFGKYSSGPTQESKEKTSGLHYQTEKAHHELKLERSKKN